MANSVPIITLTTDFGLADTYVAQMKGVILTISPATRIVDVTHEVRSQQIAQGAFLAETAWPGYPDGTVHVAVVDPGVGTQRRALVLQSERGYFIGPDNGMLSGALPDEVRPEEASAIVVPEGFDAIEITNEYYMRKPTSATFHGRDIFSPAAAWLSQGLDVGELGDPVDEIVALPPFRARRQEDGTLEGQVVHVDRYGNVITDIRSSDLPDGSFSLDVAEHRVPGPYRTFAELEGLGAIVGSGGFLGIAAPNGDAAFVLDVDIGESVRLRPET